MATLVFAACAGPSTSDGSLPASATASGSQQPTPTASESSGSDTPPPATPTPEPALNLIAWILGLGVDAPQGPPEFTAYNLLRGRDGQGQPIGLAKGCQRLLAGLEPSGSLPLADPATRLYRGAAHACLGALGAGQAHWDAAAGALAALSPPLSCMDIAAYELLTRLVNSHEANPTGTFVFQTEKSQGRRPPCPRTTAITPNVGPRSGTQVLITGSNLDRVLSVVIYFEDENGQFGPDDVGYEPGSESISLTVEDTTGIAIWACVVVQGAPGWNGDGERFTFIDPVPSLSPTATPVPNPAAPCPPPSNP